MSPVSGLLMMLPTVFHPRPFSCAQRSLTFHFFFLFCWCHLFFAECHRVIPSLLGKLKLAKIMSNPLCLRCILCLSYTVWDAPSPVLLCFVLSAMIICSELFVFWIHKNLNSFWIGNLIGTHHVFITTKLCLADIGSLNCEPSDQALLVVFRGRWWRVLCGSFHTPPLTHWLLKVNFLQY